MKLRAIRRVIFLGLLTAIGACSESHDTQDASRLAIREGGSVSDRSNGPERRSTIGLVGSIPQGQFVCTASPLSQRLVVTAAHCVVEGAQIYAFTAINAAQIQSQAELIPVQTTRLHPRYPRADTSEIRPNDIAVLALSRELPASFKAPPLVEPPFDVQSGEEVLLAGYGDSDAGGDSGTLRAVLSTLQGVDEEGRLVIFDSRRRGACSGDSGGPLFARRNGQWQLAGVLSGGPVPCRGENSYTSVAKHADFINESVRSLTQQI